MKRFITVLTFFITSLSYAQNPGKPPEFWCRAEPVSINGDDYLRFGLTAEEACNQAMKDCENHYKNCTIEGCGEWKNDGNFTGFCYLMNPE